MIKLTKKEWLYSQCDRFQWPWWFVYMYRYTLRLRNPIAAYQQTMAELEEGRITRIASEQYYSQPHPRSAQTIEVEGHKITFTPIDPETWAPIESSK